MANPIHLAILRQGVEAWNSWRDDNINIIPDLNHANLKARNLSEVNLENADLRGARFKEANLRKAILVSADLRCANLQDANLRRAKLCGANLEGANLRRAGLSRAKLCKALMYGVNLRGACITKADLSEAHLFEADLSKALLIETNLTGSTFIDCQVYGISAWDLNTDLIKKQINHRVSPPDQPPILIDNLEVAQFVYLLLHNEKIRGVIDTIGEKGVLILGRFTPERKAILDAIRNKLRELGFVPMMFDFDPSDKRDFTETIKILAGMSRFIIADISEPKSIPLELQAIVPNYAIPVVPLFHIQQGKPDEEPFAMIKDLQKYKWVFEILEYESPQILLDAFEEEIVNPAKDMADRLLPQKAEGIRKRRLGESS